MISTTVWIDSAEVQKFCQLDKESLAMIRLAVERMRLSARTYHRVLKLSGTIADFACIGASLPVVQNLRETPTG